MALPEGYKPWEHLQDMIRRDQNKLLAKYFKDLGPNWEPEITSTRGAIRTACTIDDNDTAVITLIRLFYFYIILGYAFHGLGHFYGIPVKNFQEQYATGKPQVFLYFTQDKRSVPDKLTPVDAEYSFRIMDESKSTMTPTKAKAIAKKIADAFVDGGKGITFSKGKEMATYADTENGLNLRILCTALTEGEKIIKKVLDVKDLPFDSKKLGFSDKPKRASASLPVGKEMVYGKEKPKKRWRPTAKVRFRYAYMVLDNREAPIYLVDTTGHHWDAFFKF